MATLTIADLDNGKRDLQTVDGVANSSADTTTTRYGDSVPTLAGALRRLGYAAPILYASGLTINSGLTTVSRDGVIYAPDPSLVPFTTGAWNAAQWRPVQNTANTNQVYQFPTLGDAQAAAATLPEGSAVIVEGTSQGRVVGGAYVSDGGLPAVPLPTYGDVRAYSGKASFFQVLDPEHFGFFRVVPGDASSPDNGGTTLVLADGRRVVREYTGVVRSSWFEDKSVGIALAANGEYQIDSGTHPAITTSATNLKGLGNTSIVSAASGSAITAGWTTPHWTPKKISALNIDGQGAADGITLTSAESPQLSGRWTVCQSLITNCVRGFFKLNGNIGNRIRDTNFSGNQYGYYSLGNTGTAPDEMHNGCDTIENCHIEASSVAAFYSNNKNIKGGGQISLRDTIIEGNTGHGVVLKNHVSPRFGAVLLDNVWFELNATGPSVTLDGVTEPPQDLYLDNAQNVIVRNGMVPRKSKIANGSSILFDGCTTPYKLDTEMVVDEVTSTVTMTNATINGAVITATVESIVSARAPAGSRSGAFYSRTRFVNNAKPSSKLIRQGFELDQPYSFTGTSTLSSTSVADGVTFPRCAELSIPAGNTAAYAASFNAPVGFVVIGIDAKLISGALSLFSIDGGGALMSDAKALLRDRWTTIRAVCRVNSAISGLYLYIVASTAAVIRLSAFDVAAFNTEQEAVNYYNGMTF